MVDSETYGAAVVEGIEDSAVGKVGGEATLLEHLAREGGENVMEGFVEEHIKDLFVVGTPGTAAGDGRGEMYCEQATD